MFHLPLADLLNGIVDSGLHIDRVVEPREEPIPFILAIAARKETRPLNDRLANNRLSG